jgi:hypothetical protein
MRAAIDHPRRLRGQTASTLTVSGHYPGSDLIGIGWNSSREIRRQVRVLVASNHTGVPLDVRPQPGNAAELTCLGKAMDELAKLLPPGCSSWRTPRSDT